MAIRDKLDYFLGWEGHYLICYQSQKESGASMKCPKARIKRKPKRILAVEGPGREARGLPSSVAWGDTETAWGSNSSEENEQRALGEQNSSLSPPLLLPGSTV